MSGELRLRALDTSVRVESGDPEALARVSACWRPLVRPLRGDAAPADRSFHVAQADEHWVLRGDQGAAVRRQHLDDLMLALATEVNAAAIDGCRHLAVHAAVIAREGAAVVLPGVSGAGKSTLAAACLAEGWEYVSDEALCVRDDGEVEPFPKPLALSAWGLDALGLRRPAGASPERLVGVDELGGRPAGGRPRVREVVLLDRRSEGGGPELVRAHRADALVGLLASSFNHYQAPVARIRLLARVVADARAWTLRYRDAREAAALLTATIAPSPECAPHDAGPRR